MVFDFEFTTLQDVRQLKGLVDFLAKQNLDYPQYDSWVQRAEDELWQGYKSAVCAFSDGRLVGDVIHQPHKGVSRLLEIKNVRVHPDLRMRDFARFMLKQVEVEASLTGSYDALIGDVRPEQKESVNFLLNYGFRQVAVVPLYESAKPEIVVVKFLNSTGKGNILAGVKDSILSRAI